ncbi:MAG: 23S rRNA (pseudouridine(1915)-N(3))-methyltransferase RlmH [Pseudomonadota bacterium]
MKLRLLAVGHRQPNWVNGAVADYAKRLPRTLGFELVELPPARARSLTRDQIRDDEAGRIRERLKRWGAGQQRCIALDERGASKTTAQIAESLTHWQREGDPVAMIIGGAGGLAPDLLQRADEQWSLSALTLPHGLARVVIVEQLYRAWTLTQNHPYHRE